MTTCTDCQLHGLREAYPGWRIWYVITWDGTRSGVIWCARSPDGARLLHADTAGDLAGDIADTPGPGLAPVPDDLLSRAGHGPALDRPARSQQPSPAGSQASLTRTPRPPG